MAPQPGDLNFVQPTARSLGDDLSPKSPPRPALRSASWRDFAKFTCLPQLGMAVQNVRPKIGFLDQNLALHEPVPL
jgi:hypothetical protein